MQPLMIHDAHKQCACRKTIDYYSIDLACACMPFNRRQQRPSWMSCAHSALAPIVTRFEPPCCNVVLAKGSREECGEIGRWPGGACSVQWANTLLTKCLRVVVQAPYVLCVCAWNENCISEDEVGTKPLILSVKRTRFKRAAPNHRCGALRPEDALSRAAQATQAARTREMYICTKKKPTSQY